MSKKDTQSDQLDHASGGAHLGGTRFGQQPTDAKGPAGHVRNGKGDKASPNDGKSS